MSSEMILPPTLPPAPPAPPEEPFDPLDGIPPELVPNLDALEIEDGKPVENIFAEKQYRLLTEPLYACWAGPPSGDNFLVLANVGLFYQMQSPPYAPDVMLALGVRLGDLRLRENRSYYTWERGGPPHVVIELVSDRRGDEGSLKQRQYARIGIAHYAIFDPQDRLGQGVLRSFALTAGAYQPMTAHYYPIVGLGLRLWEGAYEGQPAQWLRWCDAQGEPILTGRESRDQERQRADKAEQDLARERLKRERLEARLRELGLEP
jgi:hypothetical protein